MTDDHEIGVPPGSLSFKGQKPTVVISSRYIIERPILLIPTVTLIVGAPIVGYALGGLWGIVFGIATGVIGFFIGAKATILVIEHIRSQ